MSSIRSVARVAGIGLAQVAIVLVLLGVIETAARHWEPSSNRPRVDIQLFLQPYMMFAFAKGGGYVWQDILAKKPVPSTLEFNNYGFAERFDYTLVPDASYLQLHGKKPGERIVLLTGGSVVHGVGATSNDKTIAAQIMNHLIRRSGGTRYRVINMGMGSWIAYQQFIGLSLFGLPFDPDWIIVMDGHNDAAVPCVHGSGVGNPLGWPKMLYLTHGGTGDQRGGPLLQNLAAYSALVRVLTGIKPQDETKSGLPKGLIFDPEESDPRFLIKMENLRVSVQDRQLDFYLQAQRNVLALFQRANVILSTQPLMYDNAVSPAYRTTFDPTKNGEGRTTLKEHLDRFMAENAEQVCRSQQASQLLGYFIGRSALSLADLAGAAQTADQSRRIMYLNAEAVFPAPPDSRRPYFIDNAHMSDLGQERLGAFFAEAILSADRGRTFDYAAFAKKRQPAVGPRSK